MNNFITWEQAIKLNDLTSIAERYENQIREIVIWFSKNTYAQLFAMDLNLAAIELYQVYRNKDYSRFLFEKTEELFGLINNAKDELAPLREQFLKVAKIVSDNNLK